MMRADGIGAGLLVAAGLYAGTVAYGFGLGTLSEPGAGFFPFVASVLIVVCSGAIAFMALRPAPQPDAANAEIALPVSWLRIGLCIAALAAYAIALPLLGFTISTFLLMIGLSRIDPTVTWRTSFAIGALGAAGFWLVFVSFLQVSFPPPAFGF